MLGLVGNEGDEQIKTAYKAAYRKWHPDKNRDRKEFADERSRNITRAKEILQASDKESIKIKNQYKARHEGYKNFMETGLILEWPNYVVRFFLLFKNNIRTDTFNKIGGDKLDGKVFMDLTDESLEIKNIDEREREQILGIQTQFTKNSGMMPNIYTIH